MAVIVSRVEYNARMRMWHATVTVNAKVVWQHWFYQEGIAWKWAKKRKAQLKRREGQR